MTNEQKKQILSLRHKGSTFSEIANTLGIPSSTVRSFVRRDGMKPKVQTVATDSQRCRQCGKLLALHVGNHMKRFCSERCRQAWWRSHPGMVTKRAATSTCANCGVTFKNAGNHARRYCSRDCYFTDRFQHGGANGQQAAVNS